MTNYDQLLARIDALLAENDDRRRLLTDDEAAALRERWLRAMAQGGPIRIIEPGGERDQEPIIAQPMPASWWRRILRQPR